jgi:hypothetical protein
LNLSGRKYCGAGGAVVKLPPGAGAVLRITAPDLYYRTLFYQRLEEILQKKIMVASIHKESTRVKEGFQGIK